MRVNGIRDTLERFGVPNLVAGLGILFIISFPIAIIFASTAGRTAAESVQITYQIALVLAGLIGLPLAVWRSWTAHRQAAIGMEQLRGLQRQIALAEAGADADRLQKGAEMLQADGRAVRIAGVAILREIALNINHRYSREAFSVLTAFARSVSEEEENNNSDNPSPEYLVEAFVAIAASQKNAKLEIGRIVLQGVRLSNIQIESPSFVNCKFVNCNFWMSQIDDDCSCDFVKCEFYNTKFNFDRFSFTSYERCTFGDCEFSGNLVVSTMKDCSFRRLNEGNAFSMHGSNADIKKALK
jgi:hypothetical protein